MQNILHIFVLNVVFSKMGSLRIFYEKCTGIADNLFFLEYFCLNIHSFMSHPASVDATYDKTIDHIKIFDEISNSVTLRQLKITHNFYVNILPCCGPDASHGTATCT